MANLAYRQAQKRKLDLALKMDKEFDQWLVEFQPDQALAFVECAEVYNDITREGIVGLVKFINENSPKKFIEPDNINNHSACHFWKVGNEGSRVLYAVFQPWATPQKTNWSAWIKKVERKAKEAGCNEITTSQQLGNWIVRMWWD
jgi:hypothetical protein